MKIRMKGEHTIAGPDVVRLDDGTCALPDHQAAAVVRAGHADPVDPMPADEPGPETAEAPPEGEAAALKSRRKRG